MKVTCVKTDRDINYFLSSFQILCEHWSIEDTLDNFRRHRKTENDKRIIIIDFDEAPEFRHSKPPLGWYIIGLTSDTTLKTEYTYSLIHKFSSTESILNAIQEITDESCYRQLGHFPLYIGINRYEMDTPHGVIPLPQREWRILNYLAQNLGRGVLSEELVYHIYDAGEEYDLRNVQKQMQVYLTRLRKKFMLILDSPVISFGTKTGGYYLLDFCPPNLEYIINRPNNKDYIVVDEATEKLAKDFYQKLSQIVAKWSLYELRHDRKLMCKHRRYTFLKNNLIFKDNFSLSKLIVLLKKIRFKKIKRPMKRVEEARVRELSYQ